MSKWTRSKQTEFVRDILRDFCSICQTLEQEFTNYDTSSHVDFAVLSNLLGQEMNKGQLWRLKDTAHILFKTEATDSSTRLIGQFLDWSFGYIFHDSMKLKEDAYQQQSYAPWFQQVLTRQLSGPSQNICTHLHEVLSQTAESIQREVERIRFLLNNCKQLFIEYLPIHRNNELLARFLFDQNSLVREVFGLLYDSLIKNIYHETMYKMPLLAAQSLRRGGWKEEAERALHEAERLSPGNKPRDIALEQKLQTL